MFVAHDLAVVKNVSDRVAVMYLGKMCEVSEPNSLYVTPAHPYTKLLLSSSPVPDPEADIDVTMVEEGDVPSPIDPPSGCRFRTRCEYASERCAKEEPIMRQVSEDHFVACHHPLVSVPDPRRKATAPCPQFCGGRPPSAFNRSIRTQRVQNETKMVKDHRIV